MKKILIIFILAISTLGYGQNAIDMSADEVVIGNVGGTTIDVGSAYLPYMEPEYVTYRTRVELDGGIIIDSTYTNNIIKNLKLHNIYDDGLVWISPNSGIKKDVNNKITKAYNLFGTNDAVQTDTSKAPIFASNYASFNNSNAWKITNRRFQIANIIIPLYIHTFGVFNTSAAAIIEHGPNANTSDGFVLYTTNSSIFFRRTSVLSFVGSANWAVGQVCIAGGDIRQGFFRNMLNYSDGVEFGVNSFSDTDVTNTLNIYSRNNASVFSTGYAADYVLFKNNNKTEYIRDLMKNKYIPSLIDYYRYVSDTLINYRKESKERVQMRVIYAANNKILGTSADSVCLSLDGGVTYLSKRINLTVTDSICMAYIWGNNNVTFATSKNKVYVSTDSLTTVNQVVVYDGENPYTLHTPVNTAYPGEYFLICNPNIPSHTYDGHEVMVFGNYIGYGTKGVNPPNLYYSNDNGITLRLAYKFKGIFKDDGTALGSKTTGNILGVITNDSTEHIHGVSFREADTSFYAFTGDFAGNSFWYKGKYDYGTDTWVWSKAFTLEEFSGSRTVSLIFWGDSVMWGSDNANDTATLGLYKAKFSEIKTENKRIKIFDTDKEIVSIIKDGSLVMFNYDRTENLHKLFISTNGGANFSMETFPPFFLDIRSRFMMRVKYNDYILNENFRTPNVSRLSIRFNVK
jgi:hypothetical protein